jgi:N-terminal domain of anti-restriction factor ArdC
MDSAAEALDRARRGDSDWNVPAIVRGFTSKGIPADQIKPRENVFTFQAWRALGRVVKKGEHGVKVETWIEREVDSEDETKVIRRHRRATVFHISQTVPIGEEAAE